VRKFQCQRAEAKLLIKKTFCEDLLYQQAMLLSTQASMLLFCMVVLQLWVTFHGHPLIILGIDKKIAELTVKNMGRVQVLQCKEGL
jgi:hypothetical protein